MGKLKTVLLILFVVGVIGAFHSIYSQPQPGQPDLINNLLNTFGLGYQPEPDPVRNLDFVPSKVTSEVSRLAPQNLKATPTPSPIPATPSYYASPYPQNEFSRFPPIPPLAPNDQTLGAKTQNIPPIPPVNPGSQSQDTRPPTPPLPPNGSSSQTNSTEDIIDTILKYLKI